MKSLGLFGLTELLKKDYSATAITNLGYFDGKDEHFFSGVTNGTIVHPRGHYIFGWDEIFVPNKSNKTYAEMTPDEKLLYSDRNKALQNLAIYLKM